MFIAPVLLALVTFPGPQAEPPANNAVTLLNHEQLKAALAELAGRFPERVSVVPVGASRADRAIEALRIAVGPPAPGRPAVLVVANLEGPRVFESAVALHCAEALASGYPGDAAIARLLDATTVYIVPRANPDAAEARFQRPLMALDTGGRGVDNDRDGREGEDPPIDVDGDGLVCEIRVRDPEGAWTLSADDPRVLVKADPLDGPQERWARYTEGRDQDGDERIAEDPAGDTRFNANFSAGWEAHAADAGRFPMDEPGVRALAEFVLAHGDIQLVLTLGAQTNLVGKPKQAEPTPRAQLTRPGLLADDHALVSKLGELYRETTGVDTEASADGAGSFQRWSYIDRGLLTLDANPWSLPTKAPKEPKAEAAGDEEPDAEDPDPSRAPAAAEDPGPAAEQDPDAEESGEAEAPEADEADEVEQPSKPATEGDAGRLAWIDAVGAGERFVAWKPFEHPELGPVEIGGFAPTALHEPPQERWQELAAGHAAFLAALGPKLARVRVAEAEAEALGAGLWRVRAVIANDGLLPLAPATARRARTTRPARVQLVLPDGARLVAGTPRVLVSQVAGGGGRHELVWLVAASSAANLEVRVATDAAGSDAKTVEVKP